VIRNRFERQLKNGKRPSSSSNGTRSRKALVDNAARALDTGPADRERPSREAELEERIAQLEARLARKDNIIAEISEEYVTLKKELGEP
jgi:hypothetical protein